MKFGNQFCKHFHSLQQAKVLKLTKNLTTTCKTFFSESVTFYENSGPARTSLTGPHDFALMQV